MIGTNLCTESGQPIQLRGMSSHGLQWHGKYANKDVIKWLRDDWNMQIWRAAMYLTQGGYVNNPVLKQKVVDSVDAAVELGVYVLIDWHVMNDK
ncbi:MAG TPA: cellulase family glycosylhydrolase, partial [Treponemataceae bacterium]|nr:cellulase family glycosylhydrolase [Treponemataceae bacterium]